MFTTENLSEPDDMLTPKLILYDVEYDLSFSIKMNLRIINNLKGFSQIGIENKIYLCGSPSKDYLSGSMLLSLDITKNSSFTHLINSTFNHFYPTLANYHDSNLAVIGGINSVKCEVFNFETSKWRSIPDLPSIKYGCSSLIDVYNDYLYIIGGYNTEECHIVNPENVRKSLKDRCIKIDENNDNASLFEENDNKNTNSIKVNKRESEKIFDEVYKIANQKKNKNNTIKLSKHQILSIFRINLNSMLSWEEISINSNEKLINKSFSMVFHSKTSIYIMGGKTLNNISYSTKDVNIENDTSFYEDKSNEVIELNIDTLSFSSKMVLPRKMSFQNCRDNVNFNKGTFFFLEDDNHAIKFEVNGFRIVESHLFKKISK